MPPSPGPLRLLSLERILSAQPPPLLRPGCVVLGGRLPEDALRVLQSCGRIVAADSGADRLRALDAAAQAALVLPEAVVGDMDSITPGTRAHYAALGVPVIDLSHDQDSTDMEKALSLLLQQAEGGGEQRGSQQQQQHHEQSDHLHDQVPPPPSGMLCGSDGRPTIIMLGSLDGRVDHTLQNINMCLRFHQRARLLLVSDESVCEVLPARPTLLELDRAREGDTCGLMPLGAEVTVTRTEGLVYPCTGLTLGWGALLSTSNKVAAATAEVLVDAPRPLFWALTRYGEASGGAAL